MDTIERRERAVPLIALIGRCDCAVVEPDPLPPLNDHGTVEHLCLDALYREQRPSLLRFLRRRTSSDRALDIVQQTFLRVADAVATRSHPIANPVGYLHRTAANLAIDDARADVRRFSSGHIPVDAVELMAPDQVAALEARDMLNRLEHAMRRLKPRTREIFLAHRIDGFTYVEIAARTGLSVKSIEKHMSRAIAVVDRVMSAP